MYYIMGIKNIDVQFNYRVGPTARLLHTLNLSLTEILEAWVTLEGRQHGQRINNYVLHREGSDTLTLDALSIKYTYHEVKCGQTQWEELFGALYLRMIIDLSTGEFPFRYYRQSQPDKLIESYSIIGPGFDPSTTYKPWDHEARRAARRK